ncbi:MAG TPA: DUF4434 domain-containing protein [Bryobacteraceae bacterium]
MNYTGTWLLWLALALGLPRPIDSQTSPKVSANARLDGTFLQLLEEHGRRTEAQWRQLFESLKSIGIRNLIVQWSVADDLAFYDSKTFHTVNNVPLGTVLKMADAVGMQVLVGLVHDSGYWTRIQKDPDSIASYLAQLRSKSLTAAREMAPLLRGHSCMRGWYISQEVDDINWRSKETRNILLAHVAGLTGELRQLMPKSIIAISAFSQAQSSPDAFGRFWDEFFQHTSIDAVLFQDGVGVNKLGLNDVPVYLEAIRGASDKNHRCLWVVVELLRQTAGPPLNQSAFSAVPGSMDRIVCQIAIASKYSSGEIVGFSVPEYMTPLGGEAANKLFEEYHAWITAGAAQSCRQNVLSPEH